MTTATTTTTTTTTSRAASAKRRLFERMIDAYVRDDYNEGLRLMDGYGPAQMRAVYRAIEELHGWTERCAAVRGEYTPMGRFFGIVQG